MTSYTKFKMVILALENLEYDKGGEPIFGEDVESFTELVNQYSASMGKIEQDEVKNIMKTPLKELFNIKNI